MATRTFVDKMLLKSLIIYYKQPNGDNLSGVRQSMQYDDNKAI